MRGITITQEGFDAQNKPFKRDIDISVLFLCPGVMLSSFENTVAHEFTHANTYKANPKLRKVAGCDMAKPEPITCTLTGRHPEK
jgi:hypothetical protein